jgi:predicted Zn-dependent protease
VVVLAAAFLGLRFFLEWNDRRKALLHVEREEFDLAAPLLRAALDRHPDDLEVVQALARSYLQQKNSAQAETYLTRWSELRPDDAEPLRLRMNLYRQAVQYDQAAVVARRLVVVEPANREARKQLAQILFSAGNFKESERECRLVLEKQAGDRGMLQLLSQTRRAQGDAAEAGAILDRLLAADPNNTSALLARAILFHETDQSAQAIPLLRKVLALDKTRQRTARYHLSLALERTGQTEEARRVMAEVRKMQDAEVMDVASRVQPENLDLQVNAARALLDNGNIQPGLDLLRAVLSRDPAHGPAHAVLADYYEKHGQAAQAAEHRRRAGRSSK